MSLWRFIGAAVFTGERSWAWRRRVTFVGCSVALWGVVHAIKFEPDHAWGAIVLTACSGLFLSTLGVYYGAAGYDDHQKRKFGLDDKTAG